MYRLFSFTHAGSTFAVEASAWSGLEYLTVDGREVGRRRSLAFSGEYRFSTGSLGEVVLSFRLQPGLRNLRYSLTRRGEILVAGDAPTGRPAWLDRVTGTARSGPAVDPVQGDATPSAAPGRSRIAWVGVMLKILQSGKVLKVALAGMALSGWALLFSWQFAVTLTATIVFHEYGHVWAMQRCGVPTRGFYLIPFVGGVAIGGRARSHWEDIYISMMGPVFGLLMSVVCYVLFLATDNHLLGLVASISALVNIFNLLPIVPLDGGRVVKALVFSSRSSRAFLVMLAVSAAVFALATSFGLYLLSFFTVLGVVDLLASWQARARDQKPPMSRVGVWTSTLWYLATVALFAGIIILIAESNVPGSEIARRVLAS